jgi:hypothetical protein
VGFPIRKSSDQSSFAAPQGLSQRTTSFIASQRQGIHRMLLRHLITLMIDVRRARIRGLGSRPDVDQKDLARTSRSEPLCLPNTSDQRRGHALAGRRTMSGLSDMFPLHDVKHSPATLRPQANCSLTPDISRERRRGSWWSQTGSNRRPHACKARALPTELWPHLGGPRGDADSAMDGGPGTTRTSDLTLIRGAL